MKTRGSGQRSAACKAHCLLYHRKGIFCYPYLSKYTYRLMAVCPPLSHYSWNGNNNHNNM